MKKLGSSGSLLIPLILLLLLLFVAGGFGLWAFAGRQDYKNNVDKKIADAVAVAKQQQQTTDNQAFAEQAKQPLKDYQGPDTYGSLHIKYPKTWSSFITVVNQSGTPIDAYFHPDFIPNVIGTSFALRVQVLSSPYSQVLTQFNGSITTGKLKLTPYTAAQVPNVLGSRLTGAISIDKQGIIVLFPIRDKTLKIWTEADQFKSDFDNNVMPNVTFSP